MGNSPPTPQKSIHSFTVKDAKNRDVDLSIYKGKVLLVVNVASRCHLTSTNYTKLTQLYDKYKNQGFEILAFPCNQFLMQEPGSTKDVREFACSRFNVDFPIFQKVNVNGSDTAPIYKFLKSNKGGFLASTIKWNFTKFLVGKDGQALARYSPTTSPFAIEADIKKALADESDD